MGSHRAAVGQEPARGAKDRRPAGHQRHRSRSENGLSLAGLPIRLRPADHGLQSVSPLDDARDLGAGFGRGIWRRLFDALARADPGDGQAIDSTTGKAHRSAAGGKRGAEAQAIGRSRGGRTPKIHAIVDARGRPIAIEVTPGHLGDVRVATALISGGPAGGRLTADAAYDSDGLRRFLLERGTVPVIPNNPTRKRHHPFDETAYRQRNLIERMFGRLRGLETHRHPI
jgi:transposase